MRWTEQQLRDYEARNTPAVRQAVCEPSHGSEADLQDAIAAECKRRGWICFRGSMAHRTHRTVGEPDLIAVTSRGVWFCECKSQGQKLRPEQAAIAAWLYKLGANHMTCYSLEQFIEIVNS